MFKPSFNCQFCGDELPAYLTGAQTGYAVMCDKKDCRAAWELEHRQTIERRKKLRRRKR